MEVHPHFGADLAKLDIAGREGIEAIGEFGIRIAPERLQQGNALISLMLLVSILTLTLSSPDYALDRTAALSWPPRRAAHLLAALLIVVGSLVLTRYTAAHFGPASVLLEQIRAKL